jgi:phosphoribosylamine--glycine ligase
VLYAGVMLTPQGPMVLEFNARFGDPETQVLLPLLQTDLLDVFEACVEGRLAELPLAWKQAAAVTVVMAAQGYPDDYPTGHEITGVEAVEATGCTVYIAGAKRQDGRLLTAGGRVLSVTAVGPNVERAARNAYQGVLKLHFNEAQFRRDIGLPKSLQIAPPKPRGKKRPANLPKRRR